MIKMFEIHEDKVINGKFVTGSTNYQFAIDKLRSLIDKLDIQRKLQDTRFYRRLEHDLVKGCIMPPLTLAFIVDPLQSIEDFEKYINSNIDDAFVLDGIQRLNTLYRTYRNSKEDLDLSRPLFLNIIICSSMDNLLYRMITLNNGQKAMTARHQIEILTNNIYRFNDMPVDIQTEKERKKRTIKGAFNRADIVKAYIAFLSNSTNIDNQKIIEEKLDELIADKILNSNIPEDGLEFSQVIALIDRLCENNAALNWFKITNNLIGFSVGIRGCYDFLINIDIDSFLVAISIFDRAFSAFNTSKVRVGQQRRKLVEYYISHFKDLHDKDENELLDVLSEVD